MSFFEEPIVSLLGGVLAVFFPWLTIRIISISERKRGASRMMGLSATVVALGGLLAAFYNPVYGFGAILVTIIGIIVFSMLTKTEHVGPLLGDASEPIELIAEAQKHMRANGMKGDFINQPISKKPTLVTPDDAQTVDEWLDGAQNLDEPKDGVGGL